MEYKTLTIKELYNNELKYYENIDFFYDFNMAYCLVDPNDIAFIAINNKKILGICAIHKLNDNIYENLLVQTHYSALNQKIGKKLIEEQFSYLLKNQSFLIEPNFTNDGKKYIQHIFNQFNQFYINNIKENKKYNI